MKSEHSRNLSCKDETILVFPRLLILFILLYNKTEREREDLYHFLGKKGA